MNSLLILTLFTNFLIILSKNKCGQVEFGLRSNNVCCSDECSQCGGYNCSEGNSEIASNCCGSYISRTCKVNDIYQQGCLDDGYNLLPVVECNSTNQAPCMISDYDMNKYYNDNSNQILSTIEIIWIVIGCIFVCAILCAIYALCGRSIPDENENKEDENENKEDENENKEDENKKNENTQIIIN